ncbi:hypothetical protein FGSG_05947 [Fusarium graminearum PH-1]|uniref:Apple domain-containing protein n=1 Tax=Gibberella zeae (strain ATCC MYA-4620 / CBS 123657 / FGSC 9075 / NRRL 31084 / PH-1) TaxID=229533 RepID=I1RPH8_GIBZE|nr:hypothetical protein FGSG_05947 [Fusarium graminearum PH-1]ESU11981.1 hypothetical protein FGSG_05947 [Fusarium graminearum PH-1]|eukprot:XP_011324557.1 hypothetical protein FGSG_05947 [Fusarium graminearum PH-1]
MVAIRSFVALYAAVGIASAGKCKPESISSSILSEASTSGSVGFSSASAAESSTTVPGTTLETSINESTTETVSSAISTVATDTTTLEPSLTTLLTSFVTTSADITTVESATTTTSATPIPKCPSDIEQCFGTMEIQCSTIFGGLSDYTEVEDLNASELSGWVSGKKGTCGQDATSTAFTSTAEATTSAAATSTAPVADPVCSSCVDDAQVQCNTSLNGLELLGSSQSIAECYSFCEQDDNCQGVTRRQDNGACFKSAVDPDDVVASPQEGRDSAIKGTCRI